MRHSLGWGHCAGRVPPACYACCGHELANASELLWTCITGLVKKGSNIPVEELEAIMANADIDGDGKIDYEARPPRDRVVCMRALNDLRLFADCCV